MTAGFFRVFGVEPRLGRVFSRDDENDPSTVVLSHAVWVGQFDGDPGIVGEDVRLGGRPHTVVGVMPSDFWSFDEADAWTPFRPDPRGADENYRLIGRLAPGWTGAQAAAELQALAVSMNAEAALRAELPQGSSDDVRLGVQSYRDLLAAASGGNRMASFRRGRRDAVDRLRQRGRVAGVSGRGSPAGAGPPVALGGGVAGCSGSS